MDVPMYDEPDFVKPKDAKFVIGDAIWKPKGYAFEGEIVAVFETLAGDIRVVAELTTSNGLGMLHIFNEDQLELRSPLA